ncbi:MAG TPA: hypothetical protein P5262_02190 [Candidatus Moranbacteria bacterium]|nr:hypothetical protein [Candidatus Moranbacteria bacterium]
MGIKNNEFEKITKFTDIAAWQEGHKLIIGLIKATRLNKFEC